MILEIGALLGATFLGGGLRSLKSKEDSVWHVSFGATKKFVEVQDNTYYYRENRINIGNTISVRLVKGSEIIYLGEVNLSTEDGTDKYQELLSSARDKAIQLNAVEKVNV